MLRFIVCFDRFLYKKLLFLDIIDDIAARLHHQMLMFTVITEFVLKRQDIVVLI